MRLCAIGDLGRLGGPGAADELHQFTSSKAEVVRAAAATALIRLGDEQIVSLAEADKSWHVRRTLVPLLDRSQDPRPAVLAERLVEDSNFEVCAAGNRGRRPLAAYRRRANPIEGLGQSRLSDTQIGRAATDKALAAGGRIRNRSDRSATSGADRRFAAKMAIANGFRRKPLPRRLSPTKALASYAPTEQQRADVEHLLSSFEQPATIAERAGVLRQLISIGPVLPKILAQIAESTGRPLPDAVYHEVLPALDPTFATLERLSSDDLRERRSAADTLAGQTSAAAKAGMESSLGDLALDRLCDLTIRESDPLVWSSVLAALADESRGPATQLAYAGLSHPSPEVRRLACEHLGAHPDARHGPLLSKSLTDPNPPVVEAAIRAIGRLPSFDSPRPLEAILDTPDHTLRVEAAESLATLGYSSGTAALERLAYDPATQACAVSQRLRWDASETGRLCPRWCAFSTTGRKSPARRWPVYPCRGT